MNYRHAFHAGNFADVVKHLAWIETLSYLRRKPKPFAVIDTHAGSGLYDLSGEEAVRTGEAAGGILSLDLAGLPGGDPLRKTYLGLCGDARAYPGSPLIAARMLRAEDRLVAVEKHPEDAAALKIALRPFRRVRALCADGYASLADLLPPPERRGAILIDPPFEEPDEFAALARAFAAAYRRFPTGVYLLWFPLKSPAEAERFCGEVLAAGVRKALRLDVALNAPEAEKLAAAGLLAVNPVYGFEADMRAALAPMLPRMDCTVRFDRLAGRE